MERSPRRAGVRPGSAIMDHCHILRSFVISLVIAIAITKPTSGFTIRQQDNVLDSPPDLETGESTQLEVKYDLKELNDAKQNVTNDRGLNTTVIAIENTRNEVRKLNNYSNFNATVAKDNETSETKTQITEVNTNDTSSDYKSKFNATELSSNAYTTAALSTSQTTTKGPEISDMFTTSQPSMELQNVSMNTENSTSEGKLSENRESESAMYQHYKGEIGSTENPPTTTSNLIENKTNKSFEQSTDNITTNSLTHKEVEQFLFETNQTKNYDTAEQNITTLLTGYDYKENRSNTNMGLNSINMTDGINETLTTTPPELETYATKISEFETSTERLNTVTGDFNSLITYPSWKRYTTIERKRTSTENTTALDVDMTKAESAQTRVSLDKALGYTPIPSLERLKNDFINSQDSTSEKIETTSELENNTSTMFYPEFEVTTSTQMIAPVSEAITTKIEMISKRAGYIDNTETTTPKTVEATTSEFPLKISVNDSEIFSSMYETEPGDVEASDPKNVTGVESQSQLAEDAIKEELLREETLNDNEENAKRHRDERLVSNNVKPLKEWNATHDTNIEMITEDVLSVKPINHDKRINSSLYAVNPNYKPLKKIDVQPPKQFIRDPDDNSWRNESISSLGIVFKPKNASKSFTQVLKNKTETELSNIESEKDNKGEVPDLRVRLEKIAEVRKSKKKKINKFGDTVYSDYEESAENINSTRDDVTSPMSPSIETLLSSTTPPSSQSSPIDFDLTVNAISKEDIFNIDLTTPLTTKKPKKLNNLAEYYDTTDEYDADYVNLPKIDLKKFTQPFKTRTRFTEPPDMAFTKPMIEYTSERKGTVQYFPPTQKVTQKVNLNDYDTEFNRKVNLYTFKEPPKNVLSVSYGTISPIQTENYDQLKITEKQTMKSDNLDKNLYLTNKPRVSAEPPEEFVANDGNFNRASYVIKHYRDFINEAVKDSEDERGPDFLTYTESPIRGVTINELAKVPTIRDNAEDDYDYDFKFRKDVMNRFVDNFNQNSERFKVDFPVLYNSSVVHRKVTETGKVASSSAFMKRLYDIGSSRQALAYRKPCEPHCDNMTVELSPAYELHYYVPDQEEKEEIEPRTITVPYRYRL